MLRSRLLPTSRRDTNGRWANRKRSNIPGFIRYERLEAAAACSVVDISSTGALVQLSPNVRHLTVDEVPDLITLFMTQNRQMTDVQCKVIRRYGDSLGVTFLSQFRTLSQPKRTLRAAPAKKKK